MRTVEDALRFKDRLKKNDIKHAVVIGASMAGIKVVEVLHKYGIETWLLDLASYIFPLAAYKEVAKEIEKRVEAQGVHLWHVVSRGFLLGYRLLLVSKDRSLRSENLLPPRGVAGSEFPPLPNIPHCCLP